MVSSLDTGASVSILDDSISFHELEMAHWILQLGMNLIQSFIASHRVVSCLSLRDDWHFEFDDEEGYCSDASPIKPQRLMRDLPRLFPPHTRYLVDTGNSLAWGTHYLHPFDRRFSGKREERGGLFSASVDFASMGWAIGNAVGTSMAVADTPVVCITGDGSWLMSGQEITVAVEEQLTIIFVILNDSAYGMVRHGQTLTGAEPTANKLAKVDFAAMANSMGTPAHIINSPEDLNRLDIKTICARKGPTVLDVRIDQNEAPPIGLRTNVLQLRCDTP